MFNLNIRTIFYLRFTDFYVETVLHKAELENVPFGIDKCISGTNSHGIIPFNYTQYLMVSFEPGQREDRHTDVTNPAVPPQVPEEKQILRHCQEVVVLKVAWQ